MMSPKTARYLKTIPVWLMPLAVGAALSIAAWSHSNLWSQSNRITAIETAQTYHVKELDRLNTTMETMSMLIKDMRDLMYEEINRDEDTE